MILLLQEIKQTPYFSDCKTVLDVGSGKGKNAKMLLVEANISRVLAIDIIEDNSHIDDVRYQYERISFEEFSTDERFDIVICDMVLHLMPNIRENIERLLKLGTYVCFNVLDPADEYSNTCSTLTCAQVELHLDGVEIVYSATEKYYGVAQNGALKQWVRSTFVVKT